jgi:hypothetical protein
MKQKTDGQSKKGITQLERTAYHEAGHVMAHFRLHVVFRYVTIIPAEGFLGCVRTYPHGRKFREHIENGDYTLRERDRLENDIVIYFAGNEAEKKYCGRYNHQGATSDRHNSIDLAGYIAGEGEALEAYLRWLRLRARDLIANSLNWKAVQMVAEALLERKTLTHEEGRMIFDKAYGIEPFLFPSEAQK